MAEVYDVIVIGAGPAGYVAAIRAAQNGLKTAIVDKRDNPGGTCLNVGCIPSKTLLHWSEQYELIGHKCKDFGLVTTGLKLKLSQLMKKKRETLEMLGKGIQGLFKKNKVAYIKGEGRITAANKVVVTNDKKKKELDGKNIIIATGSEPTPLPFLDFDEKMVLSSTGALALEKVPKSMIVVGAGVIGLELGSVYARFGCEVTFVEFLDKICPSLDDEIGKHFTKILEKQGMTFCLSTEVTRGKIGKGQINLITTDRENEQTTLRSADLCLVSIGRRPYTENLGLEELGIGKDKGGFITIDNNFRTSVPSIYAIGDAVEGPMLAHKASDEGVAVADIIAGENPHINYLAIPNVVYTAPEVASVGLTEEEAKAMKISYKKGSFPFKANSRGRCMDELEGFVKVIADEKSGAVIGVHILGAHASEMIGAGVVAIEKKASVDDLANACFAHPTLSEAIKEAAMAVNRKPIHF